MIREMPPTRHRPDRRGRRTPRGMLMSTSIVSPDVLVVVERARSSPRPLAGAHAPAGQDSCEKTLYARQAICPEAPLEHYRAPDRGSGSVGLRSVAVDADGEGGSGAAHDRVLRIQYSGRRHRPRRLSGVSETVAGAEGRAGGAG